MKIPESVSLSDTLLRLKTIRESVEGHLRIRKQEETAATVIEESHRKIIEAQDKLDGNRPVRDFLREAIQSLEWIQKDYGEER